MFKKAVTKLMKSQRGTSLLEVTFAVGIVAIIGSATAQQFIDLSKYVDQSNAQINAYQQLFNIGEIIQSQASPDPDVDWLVEMTNYGMEPIIGAKQIIVNLDDLSYGATNLDITEYRLTYVYDHCGHNQTVELINAYGY